MFFTQSRKFVFVWNKLFWRSIFPFLKIISLNLCPFKRPSFLLIGWQRASNWTEDFDRNHLLKVCIEKTIRDTVINSRGKKLLFDLYWIRKFKFWCQTRKWIRWTNFHWTIVHMYLIGSSSLVLHQNSCLPFKKWCRTFYFRHSDFDFSVGLPKLKCRRI